MAATTKQKQYGTHNSQRGVHFASESNPDATPAQGRTMTRGEAIRMPTGPKCCPKVARKGGNR